MKNDHRITVVLRPEERDAPIDLLHREFMPDAIPYEYREPLLRAERKLRAARVQTWPSR